MISQMAVFHLFLRQIRKIIGICVIYLNVEHLQNIYKSSFAFNKLVHKE